MSSDFTSRLAYAHGGPLCEALFRSVPEDFLVDEELPFTPSGEGEHLFVRIRKRNSNTEWVAKQLSRFCDVHHRDIGYAGQKDRVAVTTQWFSVHLPGKPDPQWDSFNCEEFQVLESIRHNRKLKTGALKRNHFCIVLRQLTVGPDHLQSRLEQIRISGVPNYFGEQRFGRNSENLEKAEALFAGKLREKNHHRRGMYLSAARSWLFNRVLSYRVERQTWNHALAGECFILDGSHSFFCADAITDEIHARLDEMDIHPSGPLWGRGEWPVHSSCRELEETVLEDTDLWKTGLERAGLKQERRALRLPVRDITGSQPDDETLELRFTLAPGCYATSVLRELVHWDSGST